MRHGTNNIGTRRERGNATLIVLLNVTICVALSASVLLPNLARSREAETMMARERALQLAEAGIDWAVVQVRAQNGAISTATTDTQSLSVGDFSVTYGPGDANGLDDDGDTLVDEADEDAFVTLVSTGESGGTRRTIRLMMRRAVEVAGFSASIQFNVESPILDFNGNAFWIDGNEHLMDGSVDTSRPPLSGIASPGNAADLESQIASNRHDQIVGLGGTPSIAQVDAIELDRLVEQAYAVTTTFLTPGTHSNVNLGSPVAGQLESVYTAGDLHLSGNSGGAGILVVDGDLHISGGFEWVGIILVRGSINMTGGGSGKRLVGAVIVGEELSTTTPGSAVVRVTGTVDMLYSTDAVSLARQRLAIMSVMAWQEVANP